MFRQKGTRVIYHLAYNLIFWRNKLSKLSKKHLKAIGHMLHHISSNKCIRCLIIFKVWYQCREIYPTLLSRNPSALIVVGFQSSKQKVSIKSTSDKLRHNWPYFFIITIHVKQFYYIERHLSLLYSLLKLFLLLVTHAEIIEDVPGAGETAESSQNTGAPSCAVSPPSHERESYKKLGLTKQVLAVHTQKEEQAFLYRFRELRSLTALKANCSQYLERHREQVTSAGTTEHNTDTSYCVGRVILVYYNIWPLLYSLLITDWLTKLICNIWECGTIIQKRSQTGQKRQAGRLVF